MKGFDEQHRGKLSMKAQAYIALRLEIIALQAQYTALSCEYQTRLSNLAYFLNSNLAEVILDQPEKLAEIEQVNHELLARLNELGAEICQKIGQLLVWLRLQ